MTPRVREILSWYGADNPGVLTNLARMMNHGRLKGTGKMVADPNAGRRLRNSDGMCMDAQKKMWKRAKQ